MEPDLVIAACPPIIVPPQALHIHNCCADVWVAGVHYICRSDTACGQSVFTTAVMQNCAPHLSRL